jgi:hypothetical protein
MLLYSLLTISIAFAAPVVTEEQCQHDNGLERRSPMSWKTACALLIASMTRQNAEAFQGIPRNRLQSTSLFDTPDNICQLSEVKMVYSSPTFMHTALHKERLEREAQEKIRKGKEEQALLAEKQARIEAANSEKFIADQRNRVMTAFLKLVKNGTPRHEAQIKAVRAETFIDSDAKDKLLEWLDQENLMIQTQTLQEIKELKGMKERHEDLSPTVKSANMYSGLYDDFDSFSDNNFLRYLWFHRFGGFRLFRTKVSLCVMGTGQI